MKISNTVNEAMKNTRGLWSFLMVGLSLSLLMIAPEAFATAASGLGACKNTSDTVKGFVDNLNGILNIISVGVVTIAVIFAGYQIAFAHKRMGDVAPILIGGILIGASAQIAGWVIGTSNKSTSVAC